MKYSPFHLCLWSYIPFPEPLLTEGVLAMQARSYNNRSSDSFQLSAREIWCSALSLIDSHGDDAIGMASHQAEALIDNGDLAGAELWARILTAIEELQRVTPYRDEFVH